MPIDATPNHGKSQYPLYKPERMRESKQLVKQGQEPKKGGQRADTSHHLNP